VPQAGALLFSPAGAFNAGRGGPEAAEGSLPLQQPRDSGTAATEADGSVKTLSGGAPVEPLPQAGLPAGAAAAEPQEGGGTKTEPSTAPPLDPFLNARTSPAALAGSSPGGIDCGARGRPHSRYGSPIGFALPASRPGGTSSSSSGDGDSSSPSLPSSRRNLGGVLGAGDAAAAAFDAVAAAASAIAEACSDAARAAAAARAHEAAAARAAAQARAFESGAPASTAPGPAPRHPLPPTIQLRASSGGGGSTSSSQAGGRQPPAEPAAGLGPPQSPLKAAPEFFAAAAAPSAGPPPPGQVPSPNGTGAHAGAAAAVSARHAGQGTLTAASVAQHSSAPSWPPAAEAPRPVDGAGQDLWAPQQGSIAGLTTRPRARRALSRDGLHAGVRGAMFGGTGSSSRGTEGTASTPLGGVRGRARRPPRAAGGAFESAAAGGGLAAWASESESSDATGTASTSSGGGGSSSSGGGSSHVEAIAVSQGPSDDAPGSLASRGLSSAGDPCQRSRSGMDWGDDGRGRDDACSSLSSERSGSSESVSSESNNGERAGNLRLSSRKVRKAALASRRLGPREWQSPRWRAIWAGATMFAEAPLSTAAAAPAASGVRLGHAAARLQAADAHRFWAGDAAAGSFSSSGGAGAQEGRGTVGDADATFERPPSQWGTPHAAPWRRSHGAPSVVAAGAPGVPALAWEPLASPGVGAPRAPPSARGAAPFGLASAPELQPAMASPSAGPRPPPAALSPPSRSAPTAPSVVRRDPQQSSVLCDWIERAGAFEVASGLLYASAHPSIEPAEPPASPAAQAHLQAAPRGAPPPPIHNQAEQTAQRGRAAGTRSTHSSPSGSGGARAAAAGSNPPLASPLRPATPSGPARSPQPAAAAAALASPWRCAPARLPTAARLAAVSCERWALEFERATMDERVVGAALEAVLLRDVLRAFGRGA
jgi:hypothetical protein